VATAPALPDLDFEAMQAGDLLRWASSEFGDRLCLTCSWQRQSSALVHMVSELGLDVDVVELDADRCCGIRKVEPLERALTEYDAWITGIRREQSPTRAGARKVEWSDRYGVWKIQPLVDWDAKRVQAYLHVNEIPYNPLHDAGYPSIGCIPCTRPVRPGEDERAGRWAGSTKLECGIHINAPLIKESSD
jgi:3'-phosphoadenosine 5'-phosphosulfate sulfotransferase (PAPS reductase)/FAD synthetase